MRLTHFMASVLLGVGLAAAPHLVAAQPSGGQPVRPGRTTQFLFTRGAVVQRTGNQTTALTQNVRLPNGTKINVRSGIVELPSGKITTLREGDYVNAEGGIVFGTPASAADPAIAWACGLGLATTSQGLALWHWGDNGDFRGFFLALPGRQESLVFLTNGANGNKLTDEVLRLFFGPGQYWTTAWLAAE